MNKKQTQKSEGTHAIELTRPWRRQLYNSLKWH